MVHIVRITVFFLLVVLDISVRAILLIIDYLYLEMLVLIETGQFLLVRSCITLPKRIWIDPFWSQNLRKDLSFRFIY